MAKMVDGDIVLDEEETQRLIEIRLHERNRPTTEADRELIARVRGLHGSGLA